MNKTFSLVSGASLGAGLMYFLDPDRGRRRRGLVRVKGIRWSRKTREFASSTSRDVRNRAIGMGAEVKSWIQPEPPVTDRILGKRVRAKLGQFSRHPSAIDVHVTDGAVTISGPVLKDELDGICHAQLQRSHQIGVRPVEQMRQGFDQRHLGAERLIHGAQFQTNVAAADDQQPPGNLRQVQRARRIHHARVVHFERGRHRRPRAGGEDRMGEQEFTRSVP